MEMPELLTRIGWSQAQLAREVGTSPVTVSKWCSKPHTTLAYRVICMYLEVLLKGMGR